MINTLTITKIIKTGKRMKDGLGCSMHGGSSKRVAVAGARASSLPSPALPLDPHQNFS